MMQNTLTKLQLSALLLAGIAGAPQTHGAQLSSFENDISVWQIEGPITPSFSNTSGVTHGDYSMQFDGVTNWTNLVSNYNFDLPTHFSAGRNILTLDVTAQTPDWWYGITAALNSEVGGWQQLEQLFVSVNVEEHSVLEWIIDPLMMSDVIASSWSGIHFMGNTGTSGLSQLNLDNLELSAEGEIGTGAVPEPNTYALILAILVGITTALKRRT